MQTNLRFSLASAVGLIVPLSFLVFACGGGNSTPAAPTPTVQSITISSSSDLLFIGASEVFTATASMTAGGTQPATGGAWGSDSPSVASVDNSGRVTGVGSGMATIYVDFQGRRGTKLIHGLPNYQGAWSGSYAVTGCSQITLRHMCALLHQVRRSCSQILRTKTIDSIGNGRNILRGFEYPRARLTCFCGCPLYIVVVWLSRV